MPWYGSRVRQQRRASAAADSRFVMAIRLTSVGEQDDLAQLAAGREALERRPGLGQRERRLHRHGEVAPEAASGSTWRIIAWAAAAFSSSGRARSVEARTVARLPMRSSSDSSTAGPAPTPMIMIRPHIARAAMLPGQLGAPTSSRMTSNGPASTNSAGSTTTEAPRSCTAEW